MTNYADKMMENNTNDPQAYFENMNRSLGDSLTELYEPEHKVKGRDKELHQLDIQMARPLTPICLAIGLAGAGKTALVETWKKLQEERGKKVVLLSLSLGAMSSDGTTMLQKRMEELMPKLKAYEEILKKQDSRYEVVLFIDEVHMVVSIFGKGSKLGGDLLKTSLARSYVKVIAATTRTEYDTYIANDEPLARRFKNLAINEVSPSVTKEILYSWLETYNPQNKNVEEYVLDKIIKSNELYRPQFAEPAKSIDILESAAAIYKVENRKLNIDMVNQIFKEQYNVSLDFKANYKQVFNTVAKRVIGQPMALYTVDRAIKKFSFNIDTSSDRPKATMLFVGSSGVGKTEMAKALNEGIYGEVNNIVRYDMSEYSSAESESSFRQKLGSDIRHNSSAIVLFDELEKAHKYIIQVLLSVLDEGIVTYTEVGADGYAISHRISLRNTIIIGTSNAAADLFEDAHRYSRHRKSITQENMNEFSDALKQEYQDMEDDIYTALKKEKNFTPEFLGRFSNIIPFYALHESTLLEIAKMHIMKLIKLLNSQPEGYKVEIKKPVSWAEYEYDYVASDIPMFIVFELSNSNDSNFGGARAITRYIENTLYPDILEAILENPDKRRFLVSTNGKAGFQNKGYGKGLGDIIVTPAS
ncbi:AAA family ATPase [Staphylococcus equorum]|uniref:AAA family ATPase n=1 Tax=Staphylococcus equorum TaxID=246432 RepID=UPI000852D152|nr:AAA family ATPase [Staphylococcus equorum]OEL08228.1 hypothetical protein AST04_08570 [Staphylococcus equorum]